MSNTIMVNNYFKITVFSLLMCLAKFSYAGFSEANTPAELYKEACPTSWEGLLTTVPATGNNPSFSGVPPWANATDRLTFETYLRSFLITKTISNTSSTALSDDKLTAASQCIMRRNAMVDAHFGRNTNTGMPSRVSLDAIMLIINLYIDD